MPATKKKNNNASKKLKLVAFLQKASKPTKLKVIIFVVLFAGIGTILLRSSYAYAGYHPWNDPNNRLSDNPNGVNWFIWNYGYGDTAVCGKTARGYFLFGPYETFEVGASGMDLTMGFAGFPNPIDPNPVTHNYRINITENDGNHDFGPTATKDSGRTYGSPYITATAHLAPGWHWHVEYRVAALEGTVCAKGYSIFTK